MDAEARRLAVAAAGRRYRARQRGEDVPKLREAGAGRESDEERRRRWWAEHPEYKARWKAEHPESQRRTARRMYQRVRQQVFDHYGRSCACCGATERLSIDHIDSNGGEHRKEVRGLSQGGSSINMYRWLIRNGFPDGFQILCLSCNQSKGKRDRCRLRHEDAGRR